MIRDIYKHQFVVKKLFKETKEVKSEERDFFYSIGLKFFDFIRKACLFFTIIIFQIDILKTKPVT